MIKKIEGWLTQFESILAAFSLFLLLLLSLAQIIMRDFFNFGYADIDIINRNLLIICGAMGAVIATSKFRHIKIDALSTVMRPQTRARLRCPLALFSTFVCLAMCYYAYIFMLDEYQYAPANERWSLPFNAIYPLGFGLLAIHFFLNCWHRDQ